MAVISPTRVTTVTNSSTTNVANSSLGARAVGSSLSGPMVVFPFGSDDGIFYQRVYGVTVNISDDGLEQLDVLTTVQ